MSEKNSSPEVVYQDNALIVVNKPSGLLSVPGRGPDKQDCVVNRLKADYPACIEQPAVHRLDMDTSGLMVLALTADAHRILSRAFERRLVEKSYVALLDGVINKDHGMIEIRTRLDLSDRPRQIVDPVHGKLGITCWENIAVEGMFTRILFTPLTGRTHQLRVHAAHPLGLGIPIVGDRLYGSGTTAGVLKLQASHLAFQHPISLEPLSFDCPPSF